MNINKSQSYIDLKSWSQQNFVGWISNSDTLVEALLWTKWTELYMNSLAWEMYREFKRTYEKWKHISLWNTLICERHPLSKVNEQGSQPWVEKIFPLQLPSGHSNLFTFFSDSNIWIDAKKYMWDSCIQEYYADVVWYDNNWVWVSKSWYEFAYEQSLAYWSAARSDYRLIPNTIMVSNARRTKCKLKIVFEVCDQLGIWYIVQHGSKTITKDALLDPNFRENCSVYIDGKRVEIIFTDLIAERRQPDSKKFNAAYRALDPLYSIYDDQDIALENKLLNWYTYPRWNSEPLQKLYTRVEKALYISNNMDQILDVEDSRMRLHTRYRYDHERVGVAAISHHEQMIGVKAYILMHKYWGSYASRFVDLNKKYRPDNSSTTLIEFVNTNGTQIKRMTNNLFSVLAA